MDVRVSRDYAWVDQSIRFEAELRFALKLGSTDGVDLQNKPVSFSSLVPSSKLRGEKAISLGNIRWTESSRQIPFSQIGWS